ncbi:MAG: aminotransferase class I/II-fold pyridoxal phosphate-dependent enzyme [Bacteroides sp.]|nr:aminotransferase class I/II-fold pyridoxal phosphate-dependent enzyme [Bacteroides sp.]
MIEGHGDDIYRYGEAVRHNFSTNIFSAVDHSGLMRHLSGMTECLRTYPEPTPESVEKILAAEAGVERECVMVTNGATEAIYLIAQMLRGAKSAIVIPTFREYQDACRLHEHEVTFVRSIDGIPADSNAVWLCDPNNPTGRVTDKGELLGLIDRMPETVFIIDRAYSDYTSLPLPEACEVVGRPNVILLQSLTKRFAVPGLRIGYAIGNPIVISRLMQFRMPWSVNSLAIEGAKYLLAHADDYPINAVRLHEEALRIGKALSEFGVRATETDCNFLLCELPWGTAADLKNYLVSRYGILIRDASNFEGLGERHFRVAAQSADENDLLIKAIESWMTRS